MLNRLIKFHVWFVLQSKVLLYLIATVKGFWRGQTCESTCSTRQNTSTVSYRHQFTSDTSIALVAPTFNFRTTSASCAITTSSNPANSPLPDTGRYSKVWMLLARAQYFFVQFLSVHLSVIYMQFIFIMADVYVDSKSVGKYEIHPCSCKRPEDPNAKSCTPDTCLNRCLLNIFHQRFCVVTWSSLLQNDIHGVSCPRLSSWRRLLQ